MQIQSVAMANRDFAAIDNIDKNKGLANPSPPPTAKENPGALAGATGAECNDRAITGEEYRARALAARRLCLAIADCHPLDACHIMAAALGDLSAGMPDAPLFSFMDAASHWADLASEAELKSYLLACWSRLSPQAQGAFLRHIGRGAAA